MKSKVYSLMLFFWTSIVAFTMPVCMGWIYMDITGHSKGYSYDLGYETDISIMFGVVELIIWSLIAISSTAIFFRNLYRFRKFLVPIVVVFFMALFILCICFTGGWREFISWFGIK
ncbi:MAG: hypothetical protein K2O36_02500 [Ruminococcus sp.]|nr:hypothetical protein [Ruminococcus sp.]